jgi:hypothetical protein
VRTALALLLTIASHAFAHDAHKHHQKPVQGVVSLDVYRDGDAIHVLTGDADAVWHQRSGDGGRTWSAKTKVNASLKPSGMRPGNDAQVAASGARVVALWPIAGTGWGGSGPFASALSDDGGKSWRPGPTPADTGATTGHGFADLLFDRDGLHAVWLDGRDKAQGLRYALSTDGGASWGANATIAAGTCECCWNTLVRGTALQVMYRGKGPRDMRLAVLSGKDWMQRGAIASFQWDVKGCPETGGGLVAAPDGALHATVWTGLPGREGLYYASSRDGGGRWSAPLRVGTAAAQHSDLARTDSGVLGMAWDDDGRIRFARSTDGGRGWSALQEVARAADSASHPRLVGLPQGFLLLWTVKGAKGARELRTTILQ